MYFGPSTNGTEVKPAQNCPKCWFVLYFHDIAHTAPDKRGSRLDELTEVLNHVVEEVEQGTFDFTPFRRAEIKMESN